MEVVELRCDQNPVRLFAKLRREGRPRIVPSDNLIEFKCRECASGHGVAAAYHRFNLAGELVETELVPRADARLA